MNYLQLVNDFLIETQMEDTVQTLTSLRDDTEQAAVWVRDAWLEIQRARTWTFRWAVGVFPTSSGKRIYTLTDMGRTAGDKIVLDEVYALNGTKKLAQFNWRSSIGQYDTGVPDRVGQRPDKAIVLDPIPNGVHNVVFEYYAAPQVLIADDNEPWMDPSFHKAIIWKAVENYAREQGNEWRGLYQAAIRSYNAIYATLLIEYLPEWQPTKPLMR